MNAVERPYWSPYVVGAGLGVTVLASYVLLGFGPGASGAFAHVAAHVENAVAPARAQGNAYLASYLEAGRLWAQWIVVEMIGLVIGAFAGAWWGGRLRWRVERAPGLGVGRRLALAFVGGATVGFASRVAQGCTSGLALSGGAVLAPGAWAFLGAFMAAGFVTAWVVRGTWR
ncbi:MAG: YeeE/YedE family protein [Candidatus Rokubacteria bacterium]|nr:YeeE/YedE family protein [Candidatus Rokubacteria bacterium]